MVPITLRSKSFRKWTGKREGLAEEGHLHHWIPLAYWSWLLVEFTSFKCTNLVEVLSCKLHFLDFGYRMQLSLVTTMKGLDCCEIHVVQGVSSSSNSSSS